MAQVLPYELNPALGTDRVNWLRCMNRYHWFVLLVAALGWLFDCLDQQLFNIARAPAMQELLPAGKSPIEYGYYATGIFLAGWGMGGVIFGALGDRIGRAKTMMLTILIYSACTGLSAVSGKLGLPQVYWFWEFSFFRFVTGLGVGGEFAVGVALVAESVPDVCRAGSLGLLQALSAVGNVSAAGVGYAMSVLEASGKVHSSWRWLFVVGAIPALLAVFVQRKVREPEPWLRAKAEGRIAANPFGSYSRLFADPRWRKNAIVGLLLACSGVVGFWGIGVFSNDLVRAVLKQSLTAKGFAGPALNGQLTKWVSINLLMMNVGAFLGMLAYTRCARVLGRKWSFAIAFVLALAATVTEFLGLHEMSQVFWMAPILGFCQLGIFALYAIYFPELFPTSLRSTGTSFCYNFGRFVAAAGTVLQGAFAKKLSENSVDTLRHIGAWSALVFCLGLIVLPFAPETRGKPLPE